jgi:hypothetical protein
MRKKTLTYIPLILFFVSVLAVSCSKDGDGLAPCSAAWATEVNAEWTAVISAATIYAQDETAANCNALKSAYQDYINAMKPFGNCATLTGQDRADWKQAVEDAEAEVATLCQ